MTQEKNFHDAEFIGVYFARETRTLTLSFQLASGDLAVPRCEGVTHFRLGEMGLQNVLSRLLISSEREFPPDDIRKNINWACIRDGYEHAMTDARAADFLNGIQHRKFGIVVLEPSIGAELVVVCESVTHVE